VPLPELRREEKQRRTKAKAEKTSAAICFDCPGSWILANEDARNCMEMKEQRQQMGTQGNAQKRLETL
jgi:hypothetical protein